MRWLAAQAERAGARIVYRKSFAQAERLQSGFDLGDVGTTRFLFDFRRMRPASVRAGMIPCGGVCDP